MQPCCSELSLAAACQMQHRRPRSTSRFAHKCVHACASKVTLRPAQCAQLGAGSLALARRKGGGGGGEGGYACLDLLEFLKW